MKKLIVAGIDKQLKEEYTKQAQELFGEFADVKGFWVKKDKGKIKGDIVVAMTYAAVPVIKGFLENPRTEVVLAYTAFSKEAVETLRTIPTGRRVLLITSIGYYAKECIHLLKELKITHIDIIPYYEEIFGTFIENVDMAIYLGQLSYKPTFIKHYVDIGWRIITPESFEYIAGIIGIDEEKIREKMKDIKGEIAHVEGERMTSIALDYGVNSRIQNVINAIPLGIIVIRNDIIEAYNSFVCKLLGIGSEVLVHRHIEENKILSEIYQIFGRSSVQKNIYYYSKDLDKEFLISRSNVMFMFEKYQDVIIIEDISSIGKEKQEKKKELSALRAKYTFDNIVGMSVKSRETVAVAKKYASWDEPILIIGETGTGKELYAHAIHNFSSRGNNPFVSLNCAAVPDELLESELFGYEKGSFTGANTQGKKGLFEVANGGTIFLDEIGDASPKFQVKLLRVLQEQEFVRVGGYQPVSIDVRIIAATNRNLEELRSNTTFRRDLFYRISAYVLPVPSLLERREDIPILARYFLKNIGCEGKRLDKYLEEFLVQHNWEGNIRELKNCVEYIGHFGSNVLTLNDLPLLYKQDSLNYFRVDREYDDKLSFKDFTQRENDIASKILTKLEEKSCGRRQITSSLNLMGEITSEHEVRKLMGRLQKEGLITNSSGRGGSSLTEKGLNLIINKNNGG